MANTIYSKQFSKRNYFEAVLAMAQEAGNDQIVGATAYELDKLIGAAQRAAEKRNSGSNGSSDRMASKYVGELAALIMGVLTKEPQTATQIAAKLAGATVNGKDFKLNPYVYSVLGALSGEGKSAATITDEGRKNINPNGVNVRVSMVKESKLDKDGLKKEVLTKAYSID